MKNSILPAGLAAGALALAMTADRAQANNLFGISVGAYTGGINWTNVYNAGARYVFIKATEGNYYQNPSFKSQVEAAKDAGLQVGAYDFVRPDLNCPSTEANYFWNFAGSTILNDGKSISPVADWETFNGVDCEANYTAWLNAWGAAVQAKTSLTMHPIVYTSISGACDLIEFDKPGGIKLAPFIANYNGENLYTGNPWNIDDCCNAWITGCGTGAWQFWGVSSGSISGISGTVEFDAYSGGTVANLKANFGVK